MIKIFLLLISLNLFANEAIHYINKQRIFCNLIPLKENKILKQAAKNHLIYMIKNKTFSHKELNKNSKYFTGISATKRAKYLGYNGSVVENLAKGSLSYKNSLDNLFSAPYHRLGFLNLKIDEIGTASYITKNHKNNMFVYNMGNSKINALCNGVSFQGFGKYVYGVCQDKNFRIRLADYKSALLENYQRNADIIIYPYDGQKNIMPFFLEEIPDPMPNCSISGYPITVQFNQVHTKNIKILYVKLFEGKNEKEIKNIKILNYKNDPNKELKPYEIVLLPKQTLKYNTKYKVAIAYMHKNLIKTKETTFTTKFLPRPFKVVRNNQTIKIKPNTTYYLYVKPRHCNDRVRQASIKYDHKSFKVHSSFIKDMPNVIKIKVEKLKNSNSNKIVFKLSNKINFTLDIISK